MLIKAWPRELNCWCVAVSMSLSSWCSCQHLYMVNVLTTPHLQSEHHSPGIDQRSLDRNQQKRNQQRQTDIHFKKQIVEESSKIGLACISDLLLNRLHDLSLALSFSCSEQIPQDQNLLLAHHGCVAQGHEARAVLPLHTLRPLQGGLSRLALKPFPCAAQAVEPKQRVCNVCGSLWSKEMHQWIESLDIVDVRRATTWHMFAHWRSLNNDIFIFLCGRMVIQTFSRRYT